MLKDAGVLDTRAGTFVVAACSIAEFGSIVVLSMFFSPEGSADPATTILKLAVLGMVVGAIAYLGSRRGAWRRRVDEVLFRLQDSSAQLRVRVAMLLMIALLVVSESLKFDAILGSFLAGALLSAVTDPAREDELGHVRHKLEGIGFGFFVPIFFVATGLSFPVDQLFSDWSTALRVPLFLVMLLVVRGLPALVLRRDLAGPEIVPVRPAAGDVALVHRRGRADRGEPARAQADQRRVARRGGHAVGAALPGPRAPVPATGDQSGNPAPTPTNAPSRECSERRRSDLATCSWRRRGWGGD